MPFKLSIFFYCCVFYYDRQRSRTKMSNSDDLHEICAILSERQTVKCNVKNALPLEMVGQIILCVWWKTIFLKHVFWLSHLFYSQSKAHLNNRSWPKVFQRCVFCRKQTWQWLNCSECVNWCWVIWLSIMSCVSHVSWLMRYLINHNTWLLPA